MTDVAEEDAPLSVDLAGWHAEFGAALGARGVVFVGDSADVVAFDPFATEGVGVFPAAVEARVERAWAFGELRLEEGTVHAGGIEAAAAFVGARVPGGWGELRAGRDDVRFTADRAIEPEDLLLSVRPALSRAWLPLHATGGSVTLAVPGRASLQAALAFSSFTSDAPYLLVRADLFPLGPLLERPSARVDGFRFDVGGSFAILDSEALGEQRGWTVDATLRYDVASLSVSWTDIRSTGTFTGGSAELGLTLLPRRAVRPLLAARLEYVTGLDSHEDARWIGGARLGATLLAGKLTVYAEGYLPREEGSASGGSDDVVVLDDSVERANDTLLVGAQLRI